MSGHPKQAPPFITRVSVTNFRSIRTCEVELGPLVLLLGANAAGKSNLLDTIRFVCEALADSPREAIARRGGLDVLLHRSGAGAGSQASFFEISLDFSVTERQVASHGTYTMRIGRPSHSDADFVVLLEDLHSSHGEESFRIERGSSDPSDSDASPLATEDSLWLATSRNLRKYFRSFEALTAPRFYELDSTVLQDLDRSTRTERDLGPRGEFVGQILGQLASSTPEFKARLDGYLGAIVPSALGIDQRREGRFSSLEARFWTGEPVLGYWDAVNAGKVGSDDPHVLVTLPESLSEGTLLATGVLTALFQPGVTSHRIPLLAIEEPETAIHPSFVPAMFEAIHDASGYAQVIVTTQSADLLESEYLELDHLRVVENVQGASYIGPIDEGTRHVVREGLATIADLHRKRQLRPQGIPLQGRSV